MKIKSQSNILIKPPTNLVQIIHNNFLSLSLMYILFINIICGLAYCILIYIHIFYILSNHLSLSFNFYILNCISRVFHMETDNCNLYRSKSEHNFYFDIFFLLSINYNFISILLDMRSFNIFKMKH